MSERKLITCAHVINTALGRPTRELQAPSHQQEVRLELPFSGDSNEKRIRVGHIAGWQPSGAAFDANDIAVIHLSENAPGDMRAFSLVDEGTLYPCEVQFWGPAAGRPLGGHVQGTLLGAVDQTRLQVDQSIKGTIRATGGYSGGPVWQTSTGRVVGMLQAYATSNSDVDVYVISANRLSVAAPNELYRAPSCPYPGLASFDESAQPFLFGRREMTAQLESAAKKLALLAIVGPSGCGKTSLVNASLIPSMRRLADPLVCRFVPGSSVITAMAAAVAVSLGDHGRVEAIEAWEERLSSNTKSALQLARLAANASRILIVVDQAEQLFRGSHDNEQRRTFEALLATLSKSELIEGVQMILALRDEVFGQAASLGGELGQYIQTNAVIVRPMDNAELREAIEKPAVLASHGRIGFQPGLVDQIIEEYGGRAGSLPMLQFTLRELWERRVGMSLTLATYKELGGVHRALARYAESCLDGLTDDQRKSARRMLVRLVVPGTRDASRRISKDSLPHDERVVAGLLADQRLLVIHRALDESTEVLEVAHEALFREWATIQEWLAETEQFRNWEAATELARQNWEKGSHDPRLTLKGHVLDRAEEMLERSYASPALVEFVRTSRSVSASDEAASREAEKRKKALALATKAELTRLESVQGLVPSAMTAIESLQAFPTFEGDSALRKAIALIPETLAAYTHEGPIWALRFSENGKWLASCGADGRVALTDLSLGHRYSVHETSVQIFDVNFSPDSQVLVVANGDGFVTVYDVSSARELLSIRLSGAALRVNFSADGRCFIASCTDGTAQVWNMDGEPVHILRHSDYVRSAAFSHEADVIASVGEDCFLRMGSLTNPTRVRDFDIGIPLGDVKFCRSTNLVGVVATDGLPTGRHESSFQAVDRTDGTKPIAGCALIDTSVDEHPRFFGLTRDTTCLDFDPTGRWLAVGDNSGNALVFDIATGQQILQFKHGGSVFDITFSHDGLLLLTGSADGTARVLDLASGIELVRAVNPDWVRRVAFSADDLTFAAASEDGTVRIYKTSAGPEQITLRHVNFALKLSSRGGSPSISANEGSGAGLLLKFPAGMRLTRSTLGGLSRSAPSVGKRDQIRLASYSSSGDYIVTAGYDLTVRVFDSHTGSQVSIIASHATILLSKFAQDDNTILTGTNDCIRWYERDRPELSKQVTLDYKVSEYRLSDDGSLVAAVGSDRTRLIESESGSTISEFENVGFGVSFTPDLFHVLFWPGRGGNSRDFELLVINSITGMKVTRVPHHSSTPPAVSADGRLLVTILSDTDWRNQSIALYGLDGVQIWNSPAYGLVQNVAFSPLADFLVVTTTAGSVTVIDLARKVRVLSADFGAQIAKVDFSLDGRLLGTCGENSTARIYDLEVGREIVRANHLDWVEHIEFAPDSKGFLTVCQDNFARIFAVDSADLVKYATRRVLF
ncbi:trypsin-like peptidase domain-containing protein [Catellatospora citrea]|uniref:nSTAND1 domain-containing NTPase n=1 Tax=Catellatospora citrea TaxID=53366 RepID=UPI0033D4C52F